MIDLRLATLDDIGQELKKRHLHFIIFVREEHDKRQFYSTLHGSPSELLAGVDDLKTKLQEYIDNV